MKAPHLPPRLLLPLLALSLAPLSADEIKTKAGQTYTGRITYEAADIVKIELNVSGSIKETKILTRAEIASITKDAPDDVEFGKLQKLLPTPSLLPAESYRKMLLTGPEAFLKNFPGSKHTAKVQEMRDTFAKELDQVERGFLKIDNDWITPQDKIDFKELVDSRIRAARLDAYAKTPNINGYISALREYEFIEENYLGTPTFPKATETAIQVIVSLGRQLQGLATNVDYQNAEFERSLASSSPENRAQITAARAQEDKAYAERIAADKKAGIRWVQLNFRSKQSIDDYLKLAAAELTRLREYDTAALAAQAAHFVEADKLIAANQIPEAKAKLAQATSLSGQKAGSSSSPSKSKGKSGGKSGSYLSILNAKIAAKEAEEKEKAKAKAAAADSEALTANLKRNESGKGTADPDAEGAPAAEGEKGEADMAKEKEPVDEFAALGSSQKPADKKGESKGSSNESKSKSKPTKSKAKSTDDSSDDEENGEGQGKTKPRPVAVEEEGGFPFWVIPAGITLLAVIGIAVMKVLGIGGKKSED